MSARRIVVADDHPVVLQGVTALLGGAPGFEVVGRCADGDAAAAMVAALAPDVAVLDLRMPGADVLDILRRIAESGLRTRVVILTAFLDLERLSRALAAGVHGMLTKNAAADALLECLAEVAQGRRWIAPDLLDALLGYDGQERRLPGGKSLTLREQEVMRLIVDGLANKEIARALRLTEATVKIHLHSIYRKLGLSNRTELAVFALSRGQGGAAEPRQGA